MMTIYKLMGVCVFAFHHPPLRWWWLYDIHVHNLGTLCIFCVIRTVSRASLMDICCCTIMGIIAVTSKEVVQHWDVFLSTHLCGLLNLDLYCLLQIFYKVTREIFPGEELLLFMKAEEYSCDTMAPDIHGAHYKDTQICIFVPLWRMYTF